MDKKIKDQIRSLLIENEIKPAIDLLFQNMEEDDPGLDELSLQLSKYNRIRRRIRTNTAKDNEIEVEFLSEQLVDKSRENGSTRWTLNEHGEDLYRKFILNEFGTIPH